ncbi:hypothetical protein MLD38_007710 [Melastoma candidum]|uniref:Uncharacterized protein n=1 Tax=Melastoma candidum TaxID=119954 RepID=A0ACB9RTA1_9MYRT|nr:hypothetical protein MLD38_007710 [Melastoma candidum]
MRGREYWSSAITVGGLDITAGPATDFMQREGGGEQVFHGPGEQRQTQSNWRAGGPGLARNFSPARPQQRRRTHDPNQQWSNSGPNRSPAQFAHAAQVSELTNRIANLTPVQADHFLGMIQSSDRDLERLSGKDLVPINCDFEWIIDSGTSWHMTGTMASLSHARIVTDGPLIHVPNGTTRPTSTGTVNLGGVLQLRDTLFVPDFGCNLISVDRLYEDYGYTVHYIGKLCLIQDPSLGKTIGLGERRGGVWYLRKVAPVCTCRFLGCY